ncbi:MAG TPA: putative glycoside hydrolase [Gemmatimonadaceae bacterium]|nr:putative glycoside hydrolase [Gemmatimonadaceae bacterium]
MRHSVNAAVAALFLCAACRDATPASYPRVPTPNPVRGLYVNRWATLDPRIWALIGVAERTEVNALVVDVKDDRGLVLYRSQVPLAHAIGADTTTPLPAERVRAILDTMRAHDIYPIARIVVAKDPLLASHRRDWAVTRASDGAPWLDANGTPWLDPHHREIWAYAADLAEEAVRLGFSEVQFDYVRFPDDPRLDREAAFPLAQGRSRASVIREQLGYLHARMQALHVPMAIDVFGLTGSDTTDMGIGQQWEQFVDRADVVQPMDYPSHFAPGTYGIDEPNARPYETIAHALSDALQRSRGIAHAARIVPWYQDFTRGDPPYDAAQVRAQMQAGYDHGIYGWLLWNPGSEYTLDALRPRRSPAPPASPPARTSSPGGQSDSPPRSPSAGRP